MSATLYTVHIGEHHCFARGVTYEAMLRLIVERTVRAALARSIDSSNWEDEQLRHKGLASFQICQGSKAIWSDPVLFCEELAASRELNVDEAFAKEKS